MTATKIEWTEKSWNPVRGCSLVSQGCKNCYAMRQAHRFSGPGMPYEGLTVLNSTGPTWTGKVVCDESKLEEPLHWKKPCRIFVNSMSDLFHEDVPTKFLDETFAVMALCPQHTFQILTKRPQRMLEYFAESKPLQNGRVTGAFQKIMHVMKLGAAVWPGWPLPNVWLGVSVEDRKSWLERSEIAKQIPAAVRIISYEPALRDLGAIDLAGVGWFICGGESGPGARPFNIQWARSVRDQCQAAGVPFFFKQWGQWAPAQRGDPQFLRDAGGFRPADQVRRWHNAGDGLWSISVGKKAAGRKLDGREWNEYPEVQQVSA